MEGAWKNTDWMDEDVPLKIDIVCQESYLMEGDGYVILCRDEDGIGGYLDPQAQPGPLSHARLFSTLESLKKAQNSGNGALWSGIPVMIHLAATEVLEECDHPNAAIIYAHIEQHRLKDIHQVHQSEKVQELLEKIKNHHPEWLEEVGLTSSSKKSSARI